MDHIDLVSMAMMRRKQPPSRADDGNIIEKLSQEIDASLDLLGRNHEAVELVAPGSDGMRNLLQRCEALLAFADSEPAEPVRLIHHFACTGGTLIAKCISALPNTVLLSEIDPLSMLHVASGKDRFVPTDLIFHLRQAPRQVDDAIIEKVFSKSVATLATELQQRGQHLVLRDHAHSQFCTTVNPSDRNTLRQILETELSVKSVLTVRHPLDSFLSLSHNNWVHFEPKTMDQYCRRYMQFLDAYPAVRIVQYEEFVSEPAQTLSEIANILELPFEPAALDVFDQISVSGDSGRSGAEIAPRSRRDIPPDIDSERQQSETYQALCRRLNYEP